MALLALSIWSSQQHHTIGPLLLRLKPWHVNLVPWRLLALQYLELWPTSNNYFPANELMLDSIVNSQLGDRGIPSQLYN